MRFLLAFMILSLSGAALIGLIIWQENHLSWKEWQRKFFVNEQKGENKSSRITFKPEIKEIVLPFSRKKERCLTCHLGIEEISSAHPFNLGCTTCHGGDGLALDEKEAHKGLLGGRNPSDLRVVERTCGQIDPRGAVCHAGHNEKFKNHTYKVKRSLMATMAGVISSLRFLWEAQKDREPIYASMAVEGKYSGHSQKRLNTIPVFSEEGLPKDHKGRTIPRDEMGNSLEISHEPADDQWRKFCSRCHLWNQREMGPSGHAGGCASCHCLREPDNLYKGKDITLSKEKPGYARLHKFTTAIPTFQCLKCHNRGSRIGLAFTGLMESDGYGTAYHLGGLHPNRLSGDRFVINLTPDIHYEKGMHCIDCHTHRDIMGDGNIYGQMHEQVEIRCEDCHGSEDRGPRFGKIIDDNDEVLFVSRYYSGFKNKIGDEMVLTSKGNKFTNVKREDDKVILYSKINGKRFEVPIIAGKKGPHSIKAHGLKRMECYSCHSRWVAQCYGCHVLRDGRKKQLDSMAKVRSPGHWSEKRGFLRFEYPILGINQRGKVAPFVPG